MSSSLQQLLLVCPPLFLVQALAALPWLLAIDPVVVGPLLRRPLTWVYMILGAAGAGVVTALLLSGNTDPGILAGWGRIYASLLHLQLLADLFVLLFAGLLTVWPRGGAVALAAFREGIRQPMFWLLGIAAFGLMGLSVIVPYFTFGEDLKMVKELCYAQIMLATSAFSVLAASMSISEEIEGRTAVTLMSKPISRRQFLLGKFTGIFLAALVMTAILGVWLVWVLLYKQWDQDRYLAAQQRQADPAWVVGLVSEYLDPGEAASLLRGVLVWLNDAAATLPGLIIGSCQAMVLLAVAVALATRLPVFVNVPICLAVFFLGHLTPILIAVSANSYPLVLFLAQVFDTVLPGLDLFDMSTAIVRDAPLPPAEFGLYTFNVSLYAVMYTAIALLFGLVLFEDRDLA